MEKPISNNNHNNHAQAATAVAPASPTAHVLFELNPLDCREEIDEKTQRAYLNLKQMIANRTAKECHDIYLKYVAATSSNGQHNNEELTMGLLVAILVEPDGQQAKYYRDIVAFSKDGLSLFITCLNSIIVERLSKLGDHSVKQIFWITHQLLKANINFAENVCSNLIRQIPGGDLSIRNLWFIENTLELLSENRIWLINNTNFMVPTVIYTFMRLLADHMGPGQSALRQKEIDFTIGLIRERFLDCCTQIGRDFLRLLYNIVKLPEFEKLWHDIFNNPKSLHANFQSPLQILSTRTPRRLVQSRLTFDMERKINFLATQVKFGNQKRYQDWFHKYYLATPESLSLRCDLIRYICMIIHPSNEVLCSDIIPRWAIIGWLLTTCTASSSHTSKLALFFDWLLYDAKVDNIMNIEPAILVMLYSMKPHPNVTSSLLDFLCKVPTTFAPKISEHIKAGIKKSFQNCLEKKVVPSLAPLLEVPKHDPNLRTLFGPILEILNVESLSNNIPKTPPAAAPPPPIPASTPVATPVATPTPPIPNSTTSPAIIEPTPIPTGSEASSNSVMKEETRSVKVIYPFMTVPPIDFKDTVSCFDEPIRGYLEDLSICKNKRTERCFLMDKLISTVEEKDPPLNHVSITDLGHCIAYLVAEDFSTRIFPATSQESDQLEESIASPFFVLCRNIFSSAKPFSTKSINLLIHVSKFLEATGFLLLYYLRVTAVCKSDYLVPTHYLEFCNATKRKMTKCLHDDLHMALTYDAELFCFLLPSVFGDLSVHFPVTGNIELIHMVVSAIDPIHLQELICLCMTGTAKVVNREEVLPLIDASLSWESWEQYCLWKLVTAQGTPIDNYISILPKLDSRAHPEAMSSILLVLQKVSEPTATMVQHLINCDHKLSDPYLSSIFRYWSIKTDVKDLARNISSLFDPRPTSPQVKKAGQTKTASKNSTTLSTRDVKILQVLESIRVRAPKNKLLVQNEISEMLSEMENLCTESQKKKYSDLFAHRPKTTKKQKKMDKEVAS